MIDFIIRYWVEFFFGGVAAILIAKINKFQKLEKKEKVQEKQDFKKEILSEVYEADSDIKNDIKELNIKMEALNKGLLSIQGDRFKKQCRFLLKEDHVITPEEYEQCINDHEAYNCLGGNHRGDLLFDSVVEKFKSHV